MSGARATSDGGFNSSTAGDSQPREEEANRDKTELLKKRSR